MHFPTFILGTEGRIAVFTSKYNDISSLYLNILDEELNIIQQISLSYCGGAYIGEVAFALDASHYQLKGEDTSGNSFIYNIKKRPEFIAGKKFDLTAITLPQDVDRGNATNLIFEFRNFNHYHLLNLTLSVESHHGFINSITPSRVSVDAGEKILFNVTVRAASSELVRGSSYNITVADRTGCTSVSASQIINIKELVSI